MIPHEVHDAPAEGWCRHGIAIAVHVQHRCVVANSQMTHSERTP